MTFARSQKGLSLLSWLVVLAVVVFLANTVLKVVPHYLDFYALQKLIKAPEADKALEIRTPADLFSHVERGLQVNNIRDLDLRKALDVRMENNDFLVHLKYEKREPLIENLDLVVHFDREYRVHAP